MKRNGDIIAVAIIVLVILIRFAPFVLFGTQILTDSWKSYYPWRASYDPSEIKTISYDPDIEYGVWFPMVKEEIMQGRFPHWNQYSFCGAPLYANHLVPIFHVPFAISLLWPGEMILTAYSLIMAIFGTLFFYWFLRNWRLSVYASLFGAMAYFFSGWLTYLYSPEIATLVWIPAILLFYDKFCTNGKFLNASLCAFCVGQLLIAGYPIFIAHFFYVILIYAIWRRLTIEPDFPVSFKRWLFGVFVIIICGAIISAVQNIPTYEYMKISNRSISSEGEKFETKEDLIERKEIELQEIGQELGLKGLIFDQIRKKASYVVPSFDIHRTNNRNFVGPIVALFGLIGLFCAPRKYSLMKILFVIFAIFSLIAPVYTPVGRIVPLWSISIYIPREVFAFLLFYMAALGVDTLGALANRSRLAIGLCLSMLVITLFYIQYHPIFNTTNKLFMWSKTNDSIFVITYFAITIVLFIFSIFRASGKTLRPWLIYVSMIGFIVSGLGAHFYIFQYFADRNPMPYTEDVKKIVEVCRDGRIIRFDDGPQAFSFSERFDYVFPANIPAKYGIMDVFGYDSMILGNYDLFLKKIDPDSILWERAVSHYKDSWVIFNGHILETHAGTRYILTRGDLNDYPFLISNTRKIYDGGVDIYECLNSYPVIRAIPKYLVVDFDTINTIPNPAGVFVSEQPILPDGQPLDDSKNNMTLDWRNSDFIKSVQRTNSEIIVDFDVPSDCIIYVGDTYHPRWRAKVDDTEVKILEANECFRAVAVPRGSHTLRMWYDGIEVLVGGIVSLAGLFILVVISLCDSRSGKMGTVPTQ